MPRPDPAHGSAAATPSEASPSAVLSGPSDDEEVVGFLERDQLSSARRAPIGRASPSWGTRTGLWALRIFTLVVSAMVIYTFVAQLT